MWRGKLTPRKVSVLIRGLPPESATRVALNDGKPLWSLTNYQLADQYDAQQTTTWAVANKDVAPKNRTKAPEPYPRPGAGEKTTRKITAAALLAHRERTSRKG